VVVTTEKLKKMCQDAEGDVNRVNTPFKPAQTSVFLFPPHINSKFLVFFISKKKKMKYFFSDSEISKRKKKEKKKLTRMK
jgi:hypothetical protein